MFHVLLSTSCLCLFTTLFLCTPLFYLLIIPVHLNQLCVFILWSCACSLASSCTLCIRSLFCSASGLFSVLYFSLVISFLLPAFYCLHFGLGTLDNSSSLKLACCDFFLQSASCVCIQVRIILQNTTCSVTNLVTKLSNLWTYFMLHMLKIKSVLVTFGQDPLCLEGSPAIGPSNNKLWIVSLFKQT